VEKQEKIKLPNTFEKRRKTSPARKFLVFNVVSIKRGDKCKFNKIEWNQEEKEKILFRGGLKKSTMNKKTVEKKRGRKTKLNAELEKELVELISEAIPIETACRRAGIDKTTFYKWLKWGEEGKKRYKEFKEKIQRAEAEAETKLIMEISKEQSWKAKAWLLERRFKERWGKQEETNFRGRVELGKQISWDAETRELLEKITRKLLREDE